MKERLIEDNGDAGRVEVLQSELASAKARVAALEEKLGSLKRDYEDRLAKAGLASKEEAATLL